MLEFEFIRLIPEYIRQYRNFPLPVIICDRELAPCWSNEAARTLYPALLERGGLAGLFAEYDPDTLFRELEEQGSCTIADLIPFGGAGVSMLPVLDGEKTAGAVLLFLAADAHLAPGSAFRCSKTAETLSSSIRDYVDAIFSTMDAAAAKADLLHSEWVKSSFNRIGSESYRILRITENVSEYARFQSGAPELFFRAVDLTDLLLETRDAVLELGRFMGVPIRFDLPDTPCAVNADRSRLELALFNLLHNSLYYTRPGNQIEATLTKEANLVSLTIRDRGLGIPADILPTIWKPYTAYSREGRGCGIGLGLAVVKAVAAAMSATVELESKENEGTTVTLRMPAAPLSSPLPLGRDDSHTLFKNRYSRLYTGLIDAADSPYRE